jgi:hypothetical protein
MPPPNLSSLGAPPFGSTPMTRPSGNMGEAANAAAMVQEAVDMLEKALQGVPPQHPLHKTLLDSISKLSKAAPPQSASPGVGLTALKAMLADRQRQAPMAPLMGGGAGGPPPPPSPTGTPPGGGLPGPAPGAPALPPAA